jgi:hypothetical protein
MLRLIAGRLGRALILLLLLLLRFCHLDEDVWCVMATRVSPESALKPSWEAGAAIVDDEE